MDDVDYVGTLKRMRGTEVLKRRAATAKSDMVGLKEAQTNIDILDRAMADEDATARDDAVAAAGRRERHARDDPEMAN